MKTLETLVTDIYETVKGKGGWDSATSEWLGNQIKSIAHSRFSEKQQPRNQLSPSMIGTICDRELWFKINKPTSGEPLPVEALGTFFYGDILEQVVISLAMASGHKVDCIQEPIEVYGMKGTSDVVIDGMVIDVKSASSFGFSKFKNNQLKGYYKFDKNLGENVWVPPEEVDSFGYISQLSSYLAAYQDDPRVTVKDKAGFLAVKKDRFSLALDIYDLSEELENKQEEIENARRIVSGELPEERLLDVEDGKSGNRKLCTKCSYCGYKHDCWSNLRTFVYSDGPRYLTHVEIEPKVTEI